VINRDWVYGLGMARHISKKEHLFHIVLSVLTSGVWFIFYLFVIIKSVTSDKKEISLKSKKVSGGNNTIEKMPNIQNIGTYTKRKFASIQEAEDDEYFEFYDDFSFEAVGESFYRDNLLSIIEKNNAFKQGELSVEAVLVQEENNKFDEFAVAIYIDNKKVGHVSSDYSYAVTMYLDELDLKGIKVNGVIGWATNNPNPPIGLRLDFNF
jgi:hypothetical protein